MVNLYKQETILFYNRIRIKKIKQIDKILESYLAHQGCKKKPKEDLEKMKKDISI